MRVSRPEHRFFAIDHDGQGHGQRRASRPQVFNTASRDSCDLYVPFSAHKPALYLHSHNDRHLSTPGSTASIYRRRSILNLNFVSNVLCNCISTASRCTSHCHRATMSLDQNLFTLNIVQRPNAPHIIELIDPQETIHYRKERVNGPAYSFNVFGTRVGA